MNWPESPMTVVMEFAAWKYRKMAAKPGATQLSVQTWESIPGADGKRGGRRRRKALIA